MRTFVSARRELDIMTGYNARGNQEANGLIMGKGHWRMSTPINYEFLYETLHWDLRQEKVLTLPCLHFIIQSQIGIQTIDWSLYKNGKRKRRQRYILIG